jgi:predicted adenylyl cyclase CyaB
MRNIEIKARLGDFSQARSRATAMAQEPALRLQQTDTYFNVPEGRLKLREKEGAEQGAELIFYRRDNISGPRTSDYEITPIPEPEKTLEMLKAHFGIKTIVRKKRTVYLIDNIRIHLDEVEGLGAFIEIEIIVPPDDSGAHAGALMSELMAQLSIDQNNLLDCSYCDLMEINRRE